MSCLINYKNYFPGITTVLVKNKSYTNLDVYIEILNYFKFAGCLNIIMLSRWFVFISSWMLIFFFIIIRNGESKNSNFFFSISATGCPPDVWVNQTWYLPNKMIKYMPWFMWPYLGQKPDESGLIWLLHQTNKTRLVHFLYNYRNYWTYCLLYQHIE